MGKAIVSHKEKAAQNFKRFHAKPVNKINAVNFTMPKALTFLANATAIEYISNKKNGPKGTHTYRHKFGRDVKIYLHPNGQWIFISGGNFRVTDWMRG